MSDLRVLVVDDDDEQLELVERMLRVYGFMVRTSSSPIGVTNMVRDFQPDVVLLDVNIPALSGDKLVKLLRSSRMPSRLVLFSSSDRDQLRKLAEDVSADDWIQKGIEGSELADRLRAICGH